MKTSMSNSEFRTNVLVSVYFALFSAAVFAAFYLFPDIFK